MRDAWGERRACADRQVLKHSADLGGSDRRALAADKGLDHGGESRAREGGHHPILILNVKRVYRIDLHR